MKNSDHTKTVAFSHHAMKQLVDRGTNVDEVRKAIIEGEEIPAKKGRQAFRKNFSFEAFWKGKYYEIKQVMPIALKEDGRWIVITVYVFYFGGETK